MKKTQDNFDIIISGGGLTGLICALACADSLSSVLVIDADSKDNIGSATYDGRASAIAHASFNLLSAVGLRELFDKQAQPIWDIRVVDGHYLFGVSPLFLHYNHADVPEMRNKPFGHIIENRLLRQALLQQAESHDNITILHQDRIKQTHVEGGRRHVYLRSGKHCATPLLVGAEGRFSATRALMDIGVHQKAYPQVSIVCTVKHEAGHAGTAVELFLPAGPFAMLPMTDGRSNVVWTDKTRAAQAFLALSDEDFLDAVRLRFGDWLGEIELAGPRFSYPLSVLHAHTYTAERFALIGDSAHAIHPIAGQGVNLGFRDCAALAELVADAAHLGLDIGEDSLLQEYEQWRRFDNQLLINVTDFLNNLFSNDNLVLRAARDLGMKAVHHMPPLKRVLQKHAMGTLEGGMTGIALSGGLGGGLPRLLRGEPLRGKSL